MTSLTKLSACIKVSIVGIVLCTLFLYFKEHVPTILLSLIVLLLISAVVYFTTWMDRNDFQTDP